MGDIDVNVVNGLLLELHGVGGIVDISAEALSLLFPEANVAFVE
jgi:hypothetical protein